MLRKSRLMLGLILAMAPMTALTTGAVAQEGRGDEATLEARRTELEARLSDARRTGTMSRAEALRHHRALETMVRNARLNLRRPPHFISASENATYPQTISDVETALARPRR